MDYAIEFVGGPLHGLFCPEGEMADAMREQEVVTICVNDEEDEFPVGQHTYHVQGDKAEWMAAHNGEAN